MKKVVIIDDSRVILRLAKKRLAADGHQVFTYEDPGSLDVDAVAPDLILMDVNMPSFFGDDVVAFFREDHQLACPIYLFSNIPTDELERRAAECGADGFISKGDDLDEVAVKVAAILGGVSQHEEDRRHR